MDPAVAPSWGDDVRDYYETEAHSSDEEDVEGNELALKQARSVKEGQMAVLYEARKYTEYDDYSLIEERDSSETTTGYPMNGAATDNDDKVALQLLLSGIIDKCQRAKTQRSLLGQGAVTEEPTLSADDVEEEGDNDGSSAEGSADHLLINQPAASGPRKLTKAITNNRGLTRLRKKHSGNARVANREKYTKKLQKLSGVTLKADAREGSGGYNGESHGIAIHVNRSRKIT